MSKAPDKALFARIEQQLAFSRRAQHDLQERAKKLEMELQASRAEEARLRDELALARRDIDALKRGRP